jgi:hypothetical protein
MKNRIVIALAGLALLAGAVVSSPTAAAVGLEDRRTCSTSAQACDPKDCQEPCDDPACEICCCLKKILANADLTDDQLARVDEILASERDVVGPIVRMAMAKKGATCASKKGAHKAHAPVDPIFASALERVKTELCDVLTPEQKARLEADASSDAAKARTCAARATT